MLPPEPDPACLRRKLLLRDPAFRFCSREERAAGGTAPSGVVALAISPNEARFSDEPALDKPLNGVFIPD